MLPVLVVLSGLYCCFLCFVVLLIVFFLKKLFVFGWVYGALSYPSDNTPVRALDKILESGRLKDVYDRCAYYDDKVCSGEMSTAHAQNSLAKMLREDFGIKARGKKKDPDLFG